MAPERLRGEDADAGSDLWALGATLFFAVEGVAAFERPTTAATMHAIVSEVPYLTRCHGPLASVIMGLLNAHPGARPSADQVSGLLAQVTMTPPDGFAAQTAHLGTRQAPEATARYGSRPARRRRGVVVVAGVVFAAGVFAAGYATRLGTEPGAQDGRPAAMDTALTYGKGGYLPEFSWDPYPVGGCMNSDLARGRRITQSAHVECDQPHVIEVYQSRTFYRPPEEYETWPDIAYPGHDGMVQFTESVCRMIFESTAVIPATTKDGLRYRAVVPTRDAWEDHRDSYCVLYAADNHQLDKTYLVVE
jgi:hypothetical protein